MALLLAVAALVPIGCGGEAENGGSDTGGGTTEVVQASTTVTTGPLDKARFIVSANTICRVSQKRILESFAEERYSKASRGKTFADATRSYIVPMIQFQFDDIRYLGGPEGDEREVEEMVGQMQVAIETSEKRRFASPDPLVALFADFNRLARQYGVNRCPVDRAFYGPLWRKSSKGSAA